MALKTCLRCDWRDETREPTCPNCGEHPLYVMGTSSAILPSNVETPPGRERPEEAKPEAAGGAGAVSPDSQSRRSRSPAAPAVVDTTGRSTRSMVAFVLGALMLIITLGTRLNSGEGPSAPVASDTAGYGRPLASVGSPTPVVAPPPKPAGVGLIKGPSDVGRFSLTVEGVPISFSVRAPGWENHGIFMSKSTVGPQGAEAMINWTSIEGNYWTSSDADIEPCGQWWGAPPGSMTDYAVQAAAGPGTELVRRPSDVIIGGRAAAHVVFTVRKNVGCGPGFFYTWRLADPLGGAFWRSTNVGDTIRIWIVDVGGTRLYIEGDTREAADSDVEREIRQIVGSIRFGSPG